MAGAGEAERAVVVEKVGKRFAVPGGGRMTALEDISFSLGDHEILALLGPSGCGKSTLLNIIAGIQAADAGRVAIRDRAGGPPRDPAHATGVAYVFQEDRLLPWRSARRNVEFSLEAGGTGRTERRRRALEALRLVGLEGFEDSYPHQLSGGMRSRVALARSLVLWPRILLMDEPFSKLDAQTRATMHGEVVKIWSLLGTSIIFVTHDVAEAAVLADRVIVLAPRPGRIRETVAVGLERPRDPSDPALVAVEQRLRGLIG